MKITAVEAIPYTIPYSQPLRFASGQVREADHVLIRVHTDAGLIGTSDTPPRPYTYGETQGSIISVITTIFAPQMIGLDPFDREKVRQVLGRTFHNATAKGSIDIALWDIIGQAQQMPVTRLLGGYTDRLRVSHMLGFKEAGALVEEVAQMRANYGISSFKLKVGRRPTSLDMGAARALRESFGEEIELYMDANRGWHAEETGHVLAEAAELGMQFLEEPNHAAEHVGRRWLTARSPIPIAADESAPDLAAAAREIVTQGADLLAIKTARTGFTESSRIVGLAEGLGVEVYVGNQIDTQVGSAASVAFGAAFDLTSRRAAELSNFLNMADDLMAEPLHISDGVIYTRDTPGVGHQIDESKLAHYRTDSTRRAVHPAVHPAPRTLEGSR
ncbi:mandelate racemase/muconate lactonizing enzyme family protein [Nesterenkonia sphaerica]|uniref:Enolase n=1 Tax=Nesterenkonia sphaerica TaxID=1804988 RepID=A0A5R9AMB6_9MICC|nr:enolase C-terminal domain-like protein [Nesterenkonia sphaerica]TLP79968.1 enolase [Nesterenkonia sphaerica]